MKIRCKGPHTLILLLTAAFGILPLAAQTSNESTAQKTAVTEAAARAEAQAESKVSAEIVKGKLNPANSKPGDEIAVRLNEDVKSKGEVVLKKGSTIRGVVRKVQRTDGKAGAKENAAAQSMMQLEWITTGLSGTASQQLNVALQSIVYTNPLYANQQQEESGNAGFIAPRAAPAPRSGGGGGLVGGLGGAVGGAASTAGAVGAGVTGASTGVSGGAVAQTQSRLGTPAAIVPANPQTSAALQNNFGVSANQLFLVGSGQATSAGGTTTSMDLYSHMSNDTVITSPSRDFEVSSGAQMQLLVRSGQTSANKK